MWVIKLLRKLNGGPMPPCLRTDLEKSGINETVGAYYVLNLNDSVKLDTSTVAADNYDGVGAMQFVVFTVSVYSFLGVFFLLVIRFRQGTTAHKTARTQADAINNYLKMERALKLEGYKMKMLNEIEKHVVSIEQFEQRFKLLQIKQELETKDFGLGPSPKGIKKAGIKKQIQTGSRRSVLGKRRLSAPDAVSKIGFSLLFMEPKEKTINEVDEEASENENYKERQHNTNTLDQLPVTGLQPNEAKELDPETGKEFADIPYMDV